MSKLTYLKPELLAAVESLEKYKRNQMRISLVLIINSSGQQLKY